MAKGAQYRKFTRTTAGNIGYFTILILFGLFTVFPLFYCIITSLKPLDELLIFPPRFWVARPTFNNFKVLPALLSNLEIPLSRSETTGEYNTNPMINAASTKENVEPKRIRILRFLLRNFS